MIVNMIHKILANSDITVEEVFEVLEKLGAPLEEKCISYLNKKGYSIFDDYIN